MYYILMNVNVIFCPHSYVIPKMGRKKCFNYDLFNTFYLRLYGVGHDIVKDHSDSKKGNPLLSLHT